ncbi:MAG: peptidase family [Fibrobacteria bacterium]|jgi:predicted Zn-dependent protease|nr:peptidase family [Fibrobacteria bacterium]
MFSVPQAMRFSVLGIFALLFCSCDIFGTAGGFFISEDDEAQLGAEFDRQLRDSAKAEYPVFVANSPARQQFEAYVTGLAQEILKAVPASERPGYSFKFTIIDADVQNAFAVPGGYVYIYTGIIRSMRDESELAGVLAHEISHVTQHHYRDALAKQAGISLLIDALVGDDQGAIKQLVAQTFFSLAGLAVTRSNESEADKFGTRDLGLIERNPLGIAKYFTRVPNPGPQWLSSHPAPENRVESVESQVEASATLKALAADSVQTNYKSRFDAMTAVIR